MLKSKILEKEQIEILKTPKIRKCYCNEMQYQDTKVKHNVVGKTWKWRKGWPAFE